MTAAAAVAMRAAPAGARNAQALQPLDDGGQDLPVGSVARPQFAAERIAVLVQHHAHHHLLQVGTMIFEMIAYRAETSMASTVRGKLKRTNDARALLRQIYDTEVDLVPDLDAKTLTVGLHHLTQAAHDAAVRYLCEELTATETIFPGTDLRLVYRLGSG